MKEKPKVPHINARAETVHTTRLFREAFAKRRCLIPATGFYEWEKRADGRQPYRVVMSDLEPFAFAGLWEFTRIDGEPIVSATIVVGEPNRLVASIHDRMPVILPPDDYDRWLDKGAPADEARAMLKPYDGAFMKTYAVSRTVNSVKNDKRCHVLGRASIHSRVCRGVHCSKSEAGRPYVGGGRRHVRWAVTKKACFRRGD